MNRQSGERPRGGALILTVLLILLLIGAVFTVVMVLDALERPAPAGAGCRVDDGDHTFSLSAEQAGSAALIVAVGAGRDLPERALTIAVATAMQESSLRNLDHGDRDSLGLFQQRPSQGWGSPEQVQDPRYAAGLFYDRLVEVPDYLEVPLTEAAQAVQRSAFPDLYAQHEPLAAALTDALTGASPRALSCHLPEARTPAAGDEHPRFTALLDRDQPDAVISSALGGEIRLAAGSERAAWALGQWAVATAAETGVESVQVSSLRWERAGGGWEQVGPARRETPNGLETGAVIVR
ncbi:hypothetical protein [Pseudactinotalea sp. HY158]|uniref:hypothetical protein n=1 Tax=Pseudactinotalea sp. HY158 TaxID=2654547 RepID=UPI00129CCD62|nr:hypothetical protein [Pseudactinotalea sp. HY158]QGH68778.1 hypothetical protein GCE65_04150 [Pseudactinotalea sp. HY158]